MTLMVIPLQPLANQSVSFPLNDVAYTVEIDSRREGLYLTLWRAGEYVLYNRSLRAYAPVGFGLILTDTEGTDDPTYDGLGIRWLLMVEDGQPVAEA